MAKFDKMKLKLVTVCTQTSDRSKELYSLFPTKSCLNLKFWVNLITWK